MLPTRASWFVVCRILWVCMPADGQGPPPGGATTGFQIVPIKSTNLPDVQPLLNIFADTAKYPGMTIAVNQFSVASSPNMFGTFTGLRCPSRR
jgi:hypothetical protein